MPSATYELGQKMEARFGCSVNDDGPYRFLIKRGWRCDRGMWAKDPMPTLQDIPADEWDCIDFLCQEWDHGMMPARQTQ